jgi:low affinity Fe/Cu permease
MHDILFKPEYNTGTTIALPIGLFFQQTDFADLKRQYNGLTELTEQTLVSNQTVNHSLYQGLAIFINNHTPSILTHIPSFVIAGGGLLKKQVYIVTILICITTGRLSRLHNYDRITITIGTIY